MLLLIGIPSEAPLEMAIRSAGKAGIPYAVLDQREMHFCNLALGFSNNVFSARLQLRGNNYDLEKCSGVYYRMMDYLSMPHTQPDNLQYMGPANVQKSGLLHQQLFYWLDMTAIRVLNTPFAMGSNMSKPYQAQLIRETGLKIPPTCITSDMATLKSFQHKYPQLVYKSVSGIRSIVNVLEAKHDDMLPRIKYLPTQFQQKLTGFNIRVHVVGDSLFATRIESPVTDYRYARRENKTALLSAYQLPKKIENSCFRLSQQLGLPLCGIDLFLARGNHYYCFEVNPSPGYSYYQGGTGQDISGAIVKWLYYGTTK